MKNIGDSFSVNDEVICTVIAVQLDMFGDDTISYYDNGAAVSSLVYWYFWKECIHCDISDPRRKKLDDLLDKLLTDMDTQWPYNESMFNKDLQ